jgi:hypothetical protein
MDARNKRTIAGCILDTTTCYDEEFDVIVITQPANPIVAGNSKTARKFKNGQKERGSCELSV